MPAVTENDVLQSSSSPPGNTFLESAYISISWLRRPRTKLDPHWSLAYSALACLKIGISGSASFHRVRKS